VGACANFNAVFFILKSVGTFLLEKYILKYWLKSYICRSQLIIAEKISFFFSEHFKLAEKKFWYFKYDTSHSVREVLHYRLSSDLTKSHPLKFVLYLNQLHGPY
jgi:hypothetical protein